MKPEEKTIAITMSEAMWKDLVAALDRAGLAEPSGEEKNLSRLGNGVGHPLEASLRRITQVLKEDAIGLN